jgi:hypothetical protein
MGTNYYWNKEKCPMCRQNIGDELHIGKSSVGWCFSLRVYPSEEGRPVDLAQWRLLFEQGVITDEYGSALSSDEMLSIITDRGRDKPISSGFDHERNRSVEGPNNLVRHRINEFCLGHGEGTWDYLVGDFS